MCRPHAPPAADTLPAARPRSAGGLPISEWRVGALIIATIAFGLIVSPIGCSGLFAVAIAILFVLIFFSVWPSRTSGKAL